MRRYHSLTPQEEHIIVHKGTEPAGTGRFAPFSMPGVYLCRRCDAPLFLSNDKFASSCGWPSFDDAIADSVKKHIDQDGVREEIVCARCGAHLGHVFAGENYTAKNLRHCVNSASLSFTPAHAPDGLHRAIFAAGCFWGVQSAMKKLPGVIRSMVGYTGGHVVEPTYEEVCSGLTGHREAIEVVFDPKLTNYEKILKYFFSIHDPTQKHAQGPDRGEQYQSAIFYLTDEQRRIAENVMQQLQKQGLSITTELRPASIFYPAEKYHQNYHDRKEL